MGRLFVWLGDFGLRFGHWLAATLKITFGFSAASILSFLGISFVSYKSYQYLLDQLHTRVFQQFDLMPSALVNLLGILKIDVAIGIIFSAYVTRLTIQNVFDGAKHLSVGGNNQ